MVEVCVSSIDGSGEGLRLKKDVAEATVVAFYNGLRMPASDGHIFGYATGYGIYLEWDRKKRKDSDVLDLSPEVKSQLFSPNIKLNYFSPF